jgi:hypothetical protein
MPRAPEQPQVRFQPSMRSVPSAASTVAPQDLTRSGKRSAPTAASRRNLWFFAALSMVAGVMAARAFSSQELVSDVRSGSPGFKQSATGKNVHWQKNAITIYLDDSLRSLGPGTKEAVMNAFGQWVASDPNLPSISFDSGKTSTTPKRDGKSTVSFGKITAPGHEHDLAITITYSDSQSGEILEADMVLNARYGMAVLKERHGHDVKPADAAGSQDTDECANRYDAQNVATHEAGHFFGLGEDMVERRATMFPSIDECETHKRELEATDISAVGTLYADMASSEEKAAGPRACSFVGAPSDSSGLVAALVGSIFGLARLRRRGRR